MLAGFSKSLVIVGTKDEIGGKRWTVRIGNRDGQLLALLDENEIYGHMPRERAGTAGVLDMSFASRTLTMNLGSPFTTVPVKSRKTSTGWEIEMPPESEREPPRGGSMQRASSGRSKRLPVTSTPLPKLLDLRELVTGVNEHKTQLGDSLVLSIDKDGRLKALFEI